MRRVWLLVGLVLLAGCAGGDRSGPAYDGGSDDAPSTEDAGGEETEPDEQQASNETTDAGAAQNGTNETQSPPEDVPMKLASPAFEENATIPQRFTCDGEDVSPQLNVTDTPSEAETLALIVDDPDAPREEPWVHWLIWDLPAAADQISEGYPPSGDGKAFDQAAQGTNDFGNVEYGGPCPPPDHGEHRYRFTVFALDTTLGLETGANRTQLEDAMDGHVIEQDRYVGVYER